MVGELLAPKERRIDTERQGDEALIRDPSSRLLAQVVRAGHHPIRPKQSETDEPSIGEAPLTSIVDVAEIDHLTAEQRDDRPDPQASTGYGTQEPRLVGPHPMEDVESLTPMLCDDAPETPGEEAEARQSPGLGATQREYPGAENRVGSVVMGIAKGKDRDPVLERQRSNEIQQRQDAPVLLRGAEPWSHDPYGQALVAAHDG